MFEKLRVGDRVKTNLSGMATIVEVGCYGGKMVRLRCDNQKWSCPYFFESELDLKSKVEIYESKTNF